MTAPDRPDRLVDADARAAVERDLAHSFVVEASAGTGKTTLIVRRVVEHVRQGDAIESIVAITFGEAAAVELKQRLRAALEAEAADFEEASPGATNPFTRALARLGGAPIGTIHSFCASLLRERPVEAGVDPGFETLDATASDALIDDVFERWLDAIEGDATGADAVVDALAAGVSLAQLEALCRCRIEQRDLGLDPATAGPAPLALGAIDPAAAAASIVADVEAAAAARAARGAAAADTVAKRTDIAHGAVRGLKTRSGALLARALICLPRLDCPLPKTAGKWTSRAAQEGAHAALSGAAQSLESFQAATRTARAAALLAVTGRCVELYERAKAERGAIDFADMLILARDLLRRDVEVRRSFARRCRSIIVDEFQDTDPLQAEVVFLLAEDIDRTGAPPARDWREVTIGPGRLVLVGDPKQSIYRFRRADIGIYDEAKGRVLACGGRLATIAVNFRSAPAIHRWVNHRFATLIRKESGAEEQQADYVALEAPPTAVERRPAVLVLHDPATGHFEKIGDARAAEARAIAGFLHRMISRHGSGAGAPFTVLDKATQQPRAPCYGDCAVLFRTTTDLEAYEDALRARGVPYRIAGGRRFFYRTEVKAAVALFRAIDDSTDEIATLALLRGPLFAVSDDDLAAFKAAGGALGDLEAGRASASPTLARAIDLVARLRRERSRVTAVELVEEALAATRAVELFLMWPQGGQRAANLDKLVNVARRLATSGDLTFRRFVIEIDSLVKEQSREPEAESLDEDAEAVLLATMHRAKGLEWPIVVLADLGGGAKETQGFVVQRAPAAIHFAFGAKESRIVETPGFDPAREIDRARDLAERRRLFYVAATRARDLLVLPRFLKKASEKAEKQEAAGEATGSRSLADDLRDDPLFAGLDPCTLGERFDASVLPPPEEIDNPLRVEIDLRGPLPAAASDALAERAAFAEREVAAIAAASNGRAVTSASAEKALRDEADAGADDAAGAPRAFARAALGPRGVEFGTFMHRVFERIDFAGRKSPPPAVVRLFAAEHGLDAAAVAGCERLVASFFATPLAARLAGARRLLREVPFAFRRGDAIVEGAIDLIADCGDGPLYVVDWKTDDVAREGLDARVAAHRSQGEIYRQAVTAATGRSVGGVAFHFLRTGESREI